MNTPVIENALIKKFSLAMDLTDDEIALLEGVQDHSEIIPEQTDIIIAGEDVNDTLIIQSGWAYDYKLLADGRQQIINYKLSGDIIGLFAMVREQADHSVRTLTELEVFRVDPDAILNLFSISPRLAAAICWSVARHGSILSEQIIRIGRRTAYERTAHLLLELSRRLSPVGLVSEGEYNFPITQELLADTLGLTPVHINRTIRKLKKEGLIDYDIGSMKIVNRKGLTKIAEFDPAYLEQSGLSEE